jgi:RNA polymerase sigma factor (sigma-70 family)
VIDQQLIEDCLHGDRPSQERLYRALYGILISTCWRYAGNKDLAIEYLNIGFVKILLNLKKYRRDVPFELWAKRVLINTIFNEYKKNRKYKEQEIQLGQHSDLEKLGKAEEELEIELVEKVKEKINLLPPTTKKVFSLFAIDGYSHREISELLEISEGTSMWHVSDAKRRLKEMLES